MGDKDYTKVPLTTRNDELVAALMRDRRFDPTELISDAEEKIVRGWRRTFRWTDANCRTFVITTGEGTVFDEADPEDEEEEKEKEKEKTEFTVVGLQSETGSTVDPNLVVSPRAIESIRASLADLVDPFINSEQLSILSTAFATMNDKKSFAYILSHLLSRFNVYDHVKLKDDSLHKYIANIVFKPEQESIIEPTITINVGTPEEPRELQIGTSLDESERTQMTSLLTEFKDVFSWSYKYMPGIDRSIVEHRIPIKPGFKPVKQKLRRIKPEWSLMVKEEIEKQL
ncbi:hypothetical protein vseg_011916 [Gypsophila vaccaria]